MSEIVLPMTIFTAIVVLLSCLVLVARQRLEPSGPATIDVNGQRMLQVRAGRRLLWILADSGIHLPAACGGRGSCGQCRVMVESGGGPTLPTESVHISAADAAKGMRLACLLKVRNDMRIRVPESALEAHRWSCRIISNRNIATYLKELVLELPDAERIEFTAGAYVLLEVPPHRVSFRDFDIDSAYREAWRRSDLLAYESIVRESVLRAYSLANPPQQSDRVVLVVRIAVPPTTAPPGTPPGQASSYIFSLRAGDHIWISGPFGEFRARESNKEMVLIAGGAGIAPLRSIVLDQLARTTSRTMSLWYGARDLDDVCYADELTAAARQHRNFTFHIALSAPRDAAEWPGHTGFIHTCVYEQYLKTHRSPRDVEYYFCGPPVMSAAVLDMLERLGIDRQDIFFDDFGT